MTIFLKSGNLNLLEPSGPLQACNRIALPLTLPTVQEAGWTPGPVWTGARNLAPTGIRSQDLLIRRQSLYRLRYPAHMEQVSCPETSVRDCHYKLRDIPKERGSYLLRGGILKSSISDLINGNYLKQTFQCNILIRISKGLYI